MFGVHCAAEVWMEAGSVCAWGVYERLCFAAFLLDTEARRMEPRRRAVMRWSGWMWWRVGCSAGVWGRSKCEKQGLVGWGVGG